MFWNNYFKGWKGVFNYKGRSTRSEYWIFQILTWIFIFLLSMSLIIPFYLKVDNPEEELKKFSILIFFILTPYVLATISQTVRRIRDFSGSCWWALLYLPFNAILYGVPSVIIGFMPSAQTKEGDNESTQDFRYQEPELKRYSYNKKPKNQPNPKTPNEQYKPLKRLS